MSTASYITEGGRYHVFDQGMGLMNVEAAWNLLRQNPKTVTITSSVPVNTILSGFLATPGAGAGIYDREGVTVGQSYTRNYTFTRTDGPGGSTTYNVDWLGNDGTFSSAGTVSLPKGSAVTFPVTVSPATVGVHSAILTLDDTSNPGIEYSTMNTVIAPYEFNAGNNYSVALTGKTIHRGQTDHYFRSPAGAPALKVDMTGGGDAAGAGAIRFLRWHPWGLAIDSNGATNCYNPSIGGCTTGSPTSRTTSNPQAGVWEVSVDAHRRSDSYPEAAPYTLTATVLGASVSPNPDVIPSATIGTPVSRSYTLTNLVRGVHRTCYRHGHGQRLPEPRDDRASPGEGVSGHRPGRGCVAARDDRQPDGSGGRPRSLRPAMPHPHHVCDRRAERGRGLGGIGHGHEPRGGYVEGHRRWLRRPCRDDAVQLYRRVLHADGLGARKGRGHGRERAPARRLVLDGPRHGDGARVARRGRVLYGNVLVRTDGNVTVGSGDVVIQSVVAP